MKLKLHALCLAAFLMLTYVSNAQIYADSLISSNGVNNPKRAISRSDTDYALINTLIGIGSSSDITLGFSQHGLAGMVCGFTMQQDNGLISADVLNSITITLYDSKNQQIATKTGFSTENIELLQGEGKVTTFRLFVNVNKGAYDIGYAKIKVTNLLTVNNKVRIYNALLKYDCPGYNADAVVNYSNVTNPLNAVSASENDYALLTPPLLLGSSILSMHLPVVDHKLPSVVFTFGQGNTLLTPNLLTNLTATVYDFSGNTIATDSVFTLADLNLLDSGKFNITVDVPANLIDQIAGAKVQFSGLLNLFTTLKVYGAYIKSSVISDIRPSITPNGATICNGETQFIRARTKATDVSYQWYYNNSLIPNATNFRYKAANPGNYFVITKLGSCSGVAPQVVIKSGNCVDNPAPYTLKTFPNPFTSYTTLSLKDFHAKAVVSVTDKSSNTIQTIHISGGEELKLLQGKTPGLYFISVVTEDGKTYSTKVLKQ